MKNYKKILELILFSLVFCSTSFAKDAEEFITAISKEEIPIQEKYDSLSEVVPAYVMLQCEGSSMISQEILDSFQDKLNRAFVNTEKMKPVLLDKWLINKYGLDKAKNIHDFTNVLLDERYPCLVVGTCQPFIFKVSEGYVVTLSFYKFTDGGFPIVTLRKIESLSECTSAINAMLNEYIKINETKNNSNHDKKRIIIKPFVLESRKYVGQTTGDFDYIPSTFIEQDGILIRSTDDFFSRMLQYALYSTQMTKVVSTQDLNKYVNTEYDTYSFADFYIEGRIQLTDQINVYHISLFDAKTNKLIKEVKYFTSDFSIDGIFKANNNIVFSLADFIFGKDKYGVCPDIKVPGQGLYLNNIYIGWDYLEKYVLPKGKHIIYTGDYITQDSNVEVKNKNKAVDINGNVYRSFFLYLDERNWLFRGKDGERVWNLLEK